MILKISPVLISSVTLLTARISPAVARKVLTVLWN